MTDADEARLLALEAKVRELIRRNGELWERVARAQFHQDSYLWLRDVWWRDRKPNISEYGPDELDDLIAAYRAGKTPPPPRRAKFDEWDPNDKDLEARLSAQFRSWFST